jgi:hypothetical protein
LRDSKKFLHCSVLFHVCRIYGYSTESVNYFEYCLPTKTSTPTPYASFLSLLISLPCISHLLSLLASLSSSFFFFSSLSYLSHLTILSSSFLPEGTKLDEWEYPGWGSVYEKEIDYDKLPTMPHRHQLVRTVLNCFHAVLHYTVLYWNTVYCTPLCCISMLYCASPL